LQWWSDVLMGGADPHALIAATTAVAQANVEADLGRITAPTLVVTTADSPLQPVSSARDYQEKIGNSRLLVMPGDSYHVAAVHPRECAQAALDFIRAAGAGR
jgi:pimeloyl-ACP methyl ester carboxylesterase